MMLVFLSFPRKSKDGRLDQTNLKFFSGLSISNAKSATNFQTHTYILFCWCNLVSLLDIQGDVAPSNVLFSHQVRMNRPKSELDLELNPSCFGRFLKSFPAAQNGDPTEGHGEVT